MRTFWIGVLILVVATVFVFLSDGSEKLPGDSINRTDSGSTTPMIPSRNRSDRTPPPAPEPESMPETLPAEPDGDAPAKAASADRAEEPNPPGAMPYPEEGNEGVGGPGAPVTPGVRPDAVQPGVEQGGGGVGGSEPAPDAVVEAREAESAQPEARESEAQEPEAREPDAQEPVVEEDRAEPVIEEVNEPEAVDAEPVIESPAAQEPIEPEPEPEPAPEPAPAPAAAPERAPVVETREGLVLDGRWTVPGKGTSESPYRMSWEMLVAVQREYEPRLGKDVIPAWISALDGKRVSIEGYSLLPVGTTSMSELLVMLNQWDGCCIGVPPTPYDAVEVRLTKRLPSSAAQMFAQGGAIAYGRVTGTFEVDPYIAQGWLLGLYLINDAEAELFGPAGAP